jgi:two-component system, LuxR family, sensor kinase FixL
MIWDPTMEEAIDDVVRAPQRAAPIGRGTKPLWRAVALSICYIAVYQALDRLSFIGDLHGIGITPWNPSTGLAMALLIIKGIGYAPLVMAAELLSSATLPIVSLSAVPVFLGSLVVTAGYTGAGAILRYAGFQPSMRKSSDVVLLLVVTIISSGLVASGFVASYAAAGVVPWSGFAEAGFHFWIGDAIGIIVLLPLLLLLVERIKQRAQPVRSRISFQYVEYGAQGASIVAALAAVFLGTGGDHPLGLFYLLFLPLIWIAMRHGLPAVSWAVLTIQIGLIAGLEIQGHSELTFRAFQLFMFALAATGLMLGAVVSERRRLALALVNSEARRTAILSTARDGILTIDARGTIQSINPAVESLFSRPSHLLIGHEVSELIEDMPDLLHELKIALHSPAAKTGYWELNARREDRTTFPIEFTAGRLDLPDAEHYTLVVRDITFRREVEARDRQHQAQLAHVSRVSLAGEMAAGLAHELSQPLTAILAYARGCLRLLVGLVPEPAMLQEGMVELVQQAERAGDVLDRLREFVRGGEFRRVLTAIRSLIDAAVSLIRTEATQQEVEIEAKVDPGLPMVLADPVQIEQVLLNLLRNAMEAMEAANTEQRSIIIEVRRTAKHAIEISVTDTGPGVATEMTKTIFEPFTTTKSLGLGMGLSISRAIIESHGGSLRLARGVRSGAMFIFELPTVEAETRADVG